MAYLLDTNVFIQAKKQHYGFDFCPAFWDWLVVQHARQTVYSIEKVGDELAAGNDELAMWAAGRGAAFFLPPDARMLAVLGKLSSWASGQSYSSSAVSDFLNAADYYLIAHALAVGFTVVTHEKLKPVGAGKIQIPTACLGVGVKCMTPFEMLRHERARFVLGGKA
jgi:hypothetical protein